jgi:hypothetical protein
MSLKREEDGKEILIDKGETLAEIGDVYADLTKK